MPAEQNGTITATTATSSWTKIRQHISDLYWRELFDEYDHDKDGRISYFEFKTLLLECPDAKSYKTPQDIFTLADKDDSGTLDFGEFKVMMQNPELKTLFGHFTTRHYVDSVAPSRNPRRRTGFEPVSTRDRDAESGPPPGWNVPPLHIYTDSTGRYEKKFSSTCWPPALFMISISILEIVLCFYDSAESWLIYEPQKREQVWRFFTYMLVHRELLHLFSNVLLQLIFGIALEMRQGSRRVIMVYLAGVSAGSLAMSVLYPAWRVLGASAGVYAVFTAHFAILVLNWSDMKRPWKQLITLLLLVALDWGYFFCKRYWHPDLNVSNQYVTHVAGAVAGFLVGIGVFRNLEVHKWERRLWWATVTLYAALILVAVLINIFWKEHYSSYPTRP